MEILFRGQRIDNNEWITGHFVFNPFFKRAEIHAFDSDRSYVYEVKPETVGMFTGLKDKNGNKIFLGDYLSTDLERPFNIVIFKNGSFMLECYDGNLYHDIFFPTDYIQQEKFDLFEIIGNIHQNNDNKSIE